MDVAEEYGNPINVDQTYPTIGFLLHSFSQSGLLLNKNHNLGAVHILRQPLEGGESSKC